MLTLFDKQVQLRMGQANVKRWVDDIMPLLGDDDPLGVDSFATHRLGLDEAPAAYKKFQDKQRRLRQGRSTALTGPRDYLGWLRRLTPATMSAATSRTLTLLSWETRTMNWNARSSSMP